MNFSAASHALAEANLSQQVSLTPPSKITTSLVTPYEKEAEQGGNTLVSELTNTSIFTRRKFHHTHLILLFTSLCIN